LARAAFFFTPGERGQRGFYTAVLTIPSTAASGNAIIRITNNNGILCDIPVIIAPRTFQSETIRLNPSLTALVSEPCPQRTAESHRLWEILNTTGNRIYHTGPLIPPVTSTRRTSRFGTRRINQYSDGRNVTSIHAGVDFGIPTGTEVYASGAGRVVLSRYRILTGFSVIIEHAPGIYSLYYHLDSVSAAEETIVETGQLIGLSGSTGFSTGPHLHWEIRVSTENTDPDAFVSRSIIDKDLIISRIYE
jgi:murein DD-endopeptidase MepM/ murein hydrolase activator NlpD